jgi:gluconokinase
MLRIQARVTDENGVEKEFTARQNHNESLLGATVTVAAALENIKAALTEVVADLPAEHKIGMITLVTNVDAWVALDQAWQPITGLLEGEQADRQRYADALRANGVATQLEAKSGTMITAGTPLVTLLWLKNERPADYAKMAHFVSFKDFLFHEWFGINATLLKTAASSGLYNLNDNTWDAQGLALTGLTAEVLPNVINDRYVKGNLKVEIAHALGVPVNTRFGW